MSLAFSKKEIKELQDGTINYIVDFDPDKTLQNKFEALLKKEQAEKEFLKQQIEELKKN